MPLRGARLPAPQVGQIDVAEWPALAGRAVYLAVEASVQTNLTVLSLAVDRGEGAGWV